MNDDKQMQEIEEFTTREDVKFQPVHNEAGEIIALLIGSDKVLDGIIAAMAIAEKVHASALKCRGNETLN